MLGKLQSSHILVCIQLAATLLVDGSLEFVFVDGKGVLAWLEVFFGGVELHRLGFFDLLQVVGVGGHFLQGNRLLSFCVFQQLLEGLEFLVGNVLLLNRHLEFGRALFVPMQRTISALGVLSE